MKTYNKFLVLDDKKGVALISIYLVIMTLLILGAAFLNRSISEQKYAEKSKKILQATYIAEAGLERALSDLRADADKNTTWDDGGINTVDVSEYGPDTDNYYPLPYENTALSNGSYTVQLKNTTAGSDGNGNGIGDNHIWVKSTGTVDEVEKSVRVYVKSENISPWNNAIALCGGSSGHALSGNTDIRGSVHILGEDPFVDANGNGVYDAGEDYTDVLSDSVWGRALQVTDLAFDMTSSANIGNNYSGMAADLRALIVDPPQTKFNGEDVETLNTKLRLKYGKAGFGGSATAGQADDQGDSDKETLDAVYNNDGYGGTKGAANINSDNGTSNSYDLTNEIRFPSLRDYYDDSGTLYQTVDGGYQAYLAANADVTISAGVLPSSITPNSSSDFDYYDEITGKGIKKVADVLTVGGIVYIQDALTMDKSGSDKTLTYFGKASVLATGNVNINVNLLTSGAASYPTTSILGVMTPGNITFNEANIDVMGIFYSEGTVTSQKQTDVTGAFVCNYLDMGTNVPSIYQVPAVVNNLPPGMIASDSIMIIRTVGWQEVDE